MENRYLHQRQTYTQQKIRHKQERVTLDGGHEGKEEMQYDQIKQVFSPRLLYGTLCNGSNNGMSFKVGTNYSRATR